MLHKRLDYGHNGFQVPFIPRAARSSRRRSLVQKTAEDNQLCAFDLLATVAGKILLEEGNSSHLTAHGSGSSCLQNILKEENKVGDQSLTVDHFDQGSVEAVSPSLTLELGLRGLDQGRNVKDASEPLCNVSLAPSSSISLSNGLRKNGSLVKIDLNADFRCHLGMIGGNGFNSQSLEDPEILDRKPPTIVSSNNSVKVTSVNDKDHYPYSSQSPCRNNNVNVVSRDDDDENSSECIQPSTMKTARLPARASDRRTRKLLASKYWRLASKARDGDLSDNGVHCLYHSKKAGYKHPRSQRIYPFKKRKFYHYSSLSSSRADFGFKGVHNYPRKAIGTTASGCIAGQSTSFSSRDSHVKLRIKSFRVPELFIEMPETATIGSLKRTVMEAISALLGGGLHVGVLNQGKKIRDDNRTLLQSGICNGNKAGSLGFSLEPNPSKVGAPVFSEGDSLVHTTTDFPQPVSRCPIPNLNVVQQGASQVSADHFPTSLIESDYDSAPSTTDVSAEKGTMGSRALVALPEGTPRPLSVIHSHQKSKRSEMGQRRIRRPFSVSEVEALVLAVEKLGTGRWRDVKMRAFENVKHRTYVDLKDKWKTLVHTATIAPQQRRGEPVPQELLDRVLAAHGYWTQHHAKQSSSPSSVTCLFL